MQRILPEWPKMLNRTGNWNKDKTIAARAGVAISGTGIRNDFASPDTAIRAEGVQRAKNWIVAASKMGAPVVRVFAGAIRRS